MCDKSGDMLQNAALDIVCVFPLLLTNIMKGVLIAS